MPSMRASRVTSIVIGQKSTNQIAQYMERRREHSEGLRVIFREYSDIVENDILTMQRFLDVSRFLYSGGWQIWNPMFLLYYPFLDLAFKIHTQPPFVSDCSEMDKDYTQLIQRGT